jgi:hypothetical protein
MNSHLEVVEEFEEWKRYSDGVWQFKDESIEVFMARYTHAYIDSSELAVVRWVYKGDQFGCYLKVNVPETEGIDEYEPAINTAASYVASWLKEQKEKEQEEDVGSES